ncbi:MAG TPA: zinc ribbon domain-containing protein, partial [Candidatus Mcinerneyibacteriales bacterium]|nr:zinc ribbon domain-containing protein [Candidatus Mcinerneyibacteriales bacterium]
AACGEKILAVNRSGETCASCGQPVPLGAKFCPHCGEVIRKKKCPACGAVLSDENKFCPQCGHDLKGE